MSYPTIHGLENTIAKQNTLASLLVRETRNVEHLVDLAKAAKDIPDPDNDTSLNLAMESILARSVLSFESQSETFFTRVKAALLRLFTFIQNNIRKLLAWMKQAFTHSKRRREQLKKYFDEMAKELKGDGVYLPVRIKPKQAQWVVENNAVPAHMDVSVTKIRTLMAEFRDAKSTRAVNELARLVHESTHADKNAGLMRERINAIIGSQELSEDPGLVHAPINEGRYPIAALLGSKTIYYHVFGKSHNEQYGYSLVDDVGEHKEGVIIELLDPLALGKLIKANQDLIKELETFSDMILRQSALLSRAQKNADIMRKAIEGTTAKPKEQLEPWMEDYRFVAQFTDSIIRNAVMFPMQLLTHALQISSTQVNIVRSVLNTQQ